MNKQEVICKRCIVSRNLISVESWCHVTHTRDIKTFSLRYAKEGDMNAKRGASGAKTYWSAGHR